ncbi:MAG: hypothetical protein IT464_01155 [Planctomycetes bacterium]|nr:hypothetical protein [Planctomycetota bacterium]
MIRYVVSNLGAQTPQAEQDKLVAAVSQLKGVKDVALSLPRKEVTFSINGPEPKATLLEKACASAGFTLGARM